VVEHEMFLFAKRLDKKHGGSKRSSYRVGSINTQRPSNENHIETIPVASDVLPRSKRMY